MSDDESIDAIAVELQRDRERFKALTPGGQAVIQAEVEHLVRGVLADVYNYAPFEPFPEDIHDPYTHAPNAKLVKELTETCMLALVHANTRNLL